MLDYDICSIARWALTDDEGDPVRYDLRDSLVVGGYRYWGNTHFAIRMKSEDADTLDFRVPRYPDLPWQDDVDMLPWPEQPDQIFYEREESHGFASHFRPGVLIETCVSVGGVFIAPEYFAIVSRLGEPRYKVSDNGYGSRCLIVHCKHVQALVMEITADGNEHLFRAVSVDPSELVQPVLAAVAEGDED